jgi:hypothetical protein
MDTCEFSYISRTTNLPARALGIERAWDDLKAEFNRSGPGIPGATYYKTISVQGPQLFAVVDEKRVYYHDNGEWNRYITATDVKSSQMNTTDGLQRATTAEESQRLSDKISQKEQYGIEDKG